MDWAASVDHDHQCDHDMKPVTGSWEFLRGQLCRKGPEDKLNVKLSMWLLYKWE